MNKIEERKMLKEFKKMLLTGGMITTGVASLTGCNNTKTGSNTTEPTQIVTLAPTETVTPTSTPTSTVTPTATPYPEDYFEYDDEEPTYDGSLVPGYDPKNFVVGPDGKLYDSQESIDLIFGKQPEDVYAPYTYEGETYINYIVYLQFRCDMIDVEYNENNILVPKQNTKTNCK